MMIVLGTVLSYWPGVQLAWRCTAVRAVTACAHVMPARDGTVTSGGPAEGTTVTVDPSFSDVLGAGCCDSTSPAPRVVDLTGASSLRLKCSLVSSVRACATGRPTSVGTGCDGVSTPEANTPARTPATTRAATTAPMIQAMRRRYRFRKGATNGTPRPDGGPSPRLPGPEGSSLKSSPGPALVPTGAPLTTVVAAT